MINNFKTSEIITRHKINPILAAKDIPYEADLIFNAGAVKFRGQYIMIFRNDYGYRNGKFQDTNLGIAFSNDGISWNVREKPFFSAEQMSDDEIHQDLRPALDCY